MRRAGIASLLFFALAPWAGPALAADGVISMSWDTCVGPTRRDNSGPAAYSLYLSVLGIDQLHKAYDVRLIYGNDVNTVPDAWRFDGPGCQGSSMATIDHLAPPADIKACPTFMQASTPALQVKDIGFSPPSDPYETTLMRVVLANRYPNGVTTVNPATRYFLARFVFDHTRSGAGAGAPPETCGGFEQVITFRLTNGSYLTLDGIEIPFGRDGFQVVAVFNGVTPARTTSWGAIKGQYR